MWWIVIHTRIGNAIKFIFRLFSASRPLADVSVLVLALAHNFIVRVHDIVLTFGFCVSETSSERS